MAQDQPTSRPLHPAWILFTGLLGGIAAAGTAAGIITSQCGRPASGRHVTAVSCVLGSLTLLFFIWWNAEWYIISLALLGCHLAAGSALYAMVNRPYQLACAQVKRGPRVRSGLSKEMTGAICGLAGMLLLGPCLAAVYILFVDGLYSSFIPIAFDNSEALGRFFATIGICLLAAFAGGSLFVRLKQTISIGNAAWVLAAFLWSFFSLSFWCETFIGIPSFQAAPASGTSFTDISFRIGWVEFMLGSWWSLLLAFYICKPDALLMRLKRGAQVLALNLLTAVVFSIIMGVPADMFLFIGKECERRAHIGAALACYERGLIKQPNEATASWMQYQVALLHHKRRNADKALEGFRRVVAKYNANEELVKKADYFVKRLKEGPEFHRIVLPGIETRTEYHGSYCVPNSMALVMRFWGKRLTAGDIGASITGLSQGTYSVDQAWYAQDKGMRHDFIPLASTADIKRSIDAGFPVMVYVPSHIFVIFGYDEALSTFVTYDVATHDIWVEYIQKDFIKSWKRQAATMVLVYPPDKGWSVPADIRERAEKMSDGYLHFQAHFFDTVDATVPYRHLLAAAGSKGDFFLPVVGLYLDYPGLRDSINRQYDPARISRRLHDFYSHDYDEGVNLWGQIHEEAWAMPDWVFDYGITYLIAEGQWSLAESLIVAIDSRGQISNEMISMLGMIDFMNKRYEQGLDRLHRGNVDGYALYAGMACLTQKNPKEAVHALLNEIHIPSEFGENAESPDQHWTFDNFGEPSFALANVLLRAANDPGESRERLTTSWESWLDRAPFDAATGAALCRLYDIRLAAIGKEEDKYLYDAIAQKRALMQERVDRYSPEAFKPR